MSRRKKERSLTIDKAQVRHDAIISIDPKIDFGGGLNAAAYAKLVKETRAAMSTYNTLLSNIDDAYNHFQDLEKSLADISDRMLTGVATRYGKNSSEYEKAGGTRKSERKRSKRKATATAALAG